MLRFRVLASALPLVLVGVVAHRQFGPEVKPCIMADNAAIQLATAPWQARLHVSFTDDPAAANVRVRIVDDPDMADLALVDDSDVDDTDSCHASSTPEFVAIARQHVAGEPVIYLTDRDDADYRIYVRSRTVSAKDAAALLVAARRGHLHAADSAPRPHLTSG